VSAAVAEVFTPKDHSLTESLGRVVAVIRAARGLVPLEPEQAPAGR
jgi:hypothetical protein